MRRAYCWRIGQVIEFEGFEKCPECSDPNHRTYEADNCGYFTSIVAGLSGGGSGGRHCALPIHHPGSCHHDPEKIAEQIHEC